LNPAEIENRFQEDSDTDTLCQQLNENRFHLTVVFNAERHGQTMKIFFDYQAT
jgi:hypothetical protein